MLVGEYFDALDQAYATPFTVGTDENNNDAAYL